MVAGRVAAAPASGLSGAVRPAGPIPPRAGLAFGRVPVQLPVPRRPAACRSAAVLPRCVRKSVHTAPSRQFRRSRGRQFCLSFCLVVRGRYGFDSEAHTPHSRRSARWRNGVRPPAPYACRGAQWGARVDRMPVAGARHRNPTPCPDGTNV